METRNYDNDGRLMDVVIKIRCDEELNFEASEGFKDRVKKADNVTAIIMVDYKINDNVELKVCDGCNVMFREGDVCPYCGLLFEKK